MNKEMKKFKIDVSIWRILVYFAIYSFMGYVVETLFAVVRYGTWESRQSFLYGPFCAIYGIGALPLILLTQNIKKNNIKLFFSGIIIGSVVEYLTSFILEMLFGIQCWDYSNSFLNLNGRICLLYSVFWGILTVLLIRLINPLVDKIIEKIKTIIPHKYLKGIVISLSVFLLFDCLISCLAQDAFIVRTIVQNNIDVSNREYVVEKYNRLYGNNKLSKFIENVWSDKKMIRTFPQIKVEDKNGEAIYLNKFFPDIKLYYLKIYDK